VRNVVAQFVSPTGDSTSSEQEPVDCFGDEKFSSESSTFLFDWNIAPVEPTTDKIRDSFVQDCSQQVFNAVAREGIDIDEVPDLEPIPGITQQVVDVLERDWHDSVVIQ
jgi:hypothetical protein